ncbi:MAG: putative bifunctional diguanylate cyclase/phosphodiesterase [Mycobacterium leprae]
MQQTRHRSTLEAAIDRAARDGQIARLEAAARDAILQALHEARGAAATLDRIMTTSPEIMATFDESGLLHSVTPALARVLGCETADLTGRMLTEWVRAEDWPLVRQAIDTAQRGGTVTGLVLPCRRNDAGLVWLEWAAIALPEAHLVYATARDLTELKRYERLLHQSQHLYQSIFAYSRDAVYLLDRNGVLLSANPAWERITGYSAAESQGKPFTSFVVASQQEAATAAQLAVSAGQCQSYDTTILRKDGHQAELSVLAAPVVDEGVTVGTYHLARDVSEQKQTQAQLARLAYHDSLTGLANRALFTDRLEQALAHSDRNQPSLGLLYMDLDDFKIVNDSLGHRAGDQLLMETARRLHSCVSADDVVARMGGDEFTVLLQHTDDTDDAIRVAEAILAKMAEPFVIDGRKMVVTPSIGVVMGNQGTDSKELMRHADIAMYQAKLKGKARYEAFTPVMYSHALQRLDLEGALRRALERNEFKVYYQPIIDLHTGRINSVEALVRWEEPVRGLIMPAQFIPLAEETGLILQIGKFVLQEACRQVRQWRELHPDLVVSVNLSAKQFLQPFLAEEIATVLLETGVDPACLQLEITETVLMQDAAWTQDTLRVLKSIGIGLAMDDFGTGYSSLSYLKRFPIDVLKIDRSFVTGLGESPEDDALVRTMNLLAKSLHLKVTAEGVESSDQLTHLRTMGCEHGQGYFFAKPLTSADMATLLEKQPQW